MKASGILSRLLQNRVCLPCTKSKSIFSVQPSLSHRSPSMFLAVFNEGCAMKKLSQVSGLSGSFYYSLFVFSVLY